MKHLRTILLLIACFVVTSRVDAQIGKSMLSGVPCICFGCSFWLYFPDTPCTV